MQQPASLVTTIKLRWCVRDPADGKVVRLQRPVQMRTTINGREIREIITSYTHAKYPAIGAPLKIELSSSQFGVQIIQSETTETVTAAAATTTTTAAAAAGSTGTLAPAPPAAFTYRAVCDGDMFYLPLCFPGPRLANQWCPEFRVTFPEPAQNVDTPGVYETLGAVPQLIDAGANLTNPELAQDGVACIVHRAAVAGVSQIVALGADLESSRGCVALA
jgi:hypothetical protein